MPGPRYRLIKGDFYILYPDLPKNGPEPDGDTITFLPDNDDLVQNLPRFSGKPPDRRHLGAYSVRFESIDALETHFGNQHQNLEFARAARDRMLKLVGFDTVEFSATHPNKVQRAVPHPARGYLLANGIESNGRVLGLVYPGDPDESLEDGQRVLVDAPMLEESVNGTLVKEGLAFAELYSTMPLDLIVKMRELVKAARTSGLNLWPLDGPSPSSRVQLTGLPDLSVRVMFPKLYRRLVTYYDEGHSDLSQFDAFIRADVVKRDDRALLPTGEMGNLHDLYNIDADGMKLQFFPEDLTFETDPV
jgi:endonuclease YncB( thermonuclease family)